MHGQVNIQSSRGVLDIIIALQTTFTFLSIGQQSSFRTSFLRSVETISALVTMTDITISIMIQGLQLQQLTIPSSSTFGALRRRVEEENGYTDGGLRLIHKGKIMGDDASLESGGVKTGTKLLFMRTAKQLQADKDAARRAKLQTPGTEGPANLSEARAAAASKADAQSSTSQSNSSKAITPRGDAVIAGVAHVMLQNGRERIRINAGADVAVSTVRERAGMELGVSATAIRLLGGGRFLKDGGSLGEAGVRDGASIMIMMSRGFHESQTKREDVGRVEKETAALAARVQGARKRAAHRLLEGGELLLVRGELRGEVGRLKGNLDASGDKDERKDKLLKQLAELEESIEELL